MNPRKISQDWNSFCQKINIQNKGYEGFKLMALVKVRIKNPSGSAALWARVDNINGGLGFFDNMSDKPIQLNKWDNYTIEGIIDEHSSKLYFGGFCINDGEFYFKNFRLFLINKKKELEKVKIANPNLNNVTSQLSIPGWTQGIGKKKPSQILEYSFISEFSKKKESHLKITFTNHFYSFKVHDDEIYELLRMLQDVSMRMIRSIQDLTIDQLDYRENSKLNSIAVLIMHICAVESFYQVFTFENRIFNNDEEKRFQSVLKMDSQTYKTFVNLNVQYYINEYQNVRKVTLENFKYRNNNWLKNRTSDSDKTNHYHWLHVLEHQSYHVGQIEMIKKMMD